MKKEDRKKRIRTKLRARADRPRLSVSVSNKHIYAQIIEDRKGTTLVSAKDTDIRKEGGKNINLAKEIGELLARRAKEKRIRDVVFDRGSYKYHGRIKALAQGAREGGLNF